LICVRPDQRLRTGSGMRFVNGRRGSLLRLRGSLGHEGIVNRRGCTSGWLLPEHRRCNSLSLRRTRTGSGLVNRGGPGFRSEGLVIASSHRLHYGGTGQIARKDRGDLGCFVPILVGANAHEIPLLRGIPVLHDLRTVAFFFQLSGQFFGVRPFEERSDLNG
jgi:hypothetical protein